MRAILALLAAAALVGTAAPSSAQTSRRISGHSERLAARARRGDRVARTKLVEEHMGLVRSVAVRYRDLGLPADDLVQEGAIGLLGAIDNYDPSQGAMFSTYAFWRVRAAITHALTAQGQLIRVPRPVLERRRDVARARERLGTAGREPTVTELAAATSLPAADVVDALSPPRVASLDQPTAAGAMLGDLVADDVVASPEACAIEHERARALRTALAHLRGRKQIIVNRHFGLTGNAETLNDIAADLHLSPERTRALKDEALRELAANLQTTTAA
jgi:RNA polymerase sigma factor (sigma-70 family)